mgnify:FL=1
MITASSLCKSYCQGGSGSILAVNDISFTIAHGECCVLTGESGSGKTTLLSMIGALTRPTSGSITIENRNLADCSDNGLARVRRTIGFVFQESSLLPNLPVWENVTYPLIPQGVRSGERLELAQRLMERMGLTSRIHARPEQLSGGERQRVAMARALAIQPKILLADEPTSNLDNRSAACMMEWLQEIHAKDTTLVMASHSPKLLKLATTVMELKAGKLV